MSLRAFRVLVAVLLMLSVLSVAHAQNNTIFIPLDELDSSNATLSNQSQNAGAPSTPIKPSLTKPELEALSQNCVQTFECREFAQGEHYYGCYYDPASKDCRCFTGDMSLCKNNDLRCAFEFECKKSEVAPGYNYDCTYDKDKEGCTCFTGEFQLCRQEVSNKREIHAPTQEPKPTEEPPAQPPVEQDPTPAPAAGNQTITQEQSPSLPGTAIAIVAAIVLVVVIFFLYNTTKESGSNLLRRARSYHKRAEEAHERGDEEEAKRLFALAEQDRRKALKRKSR